MLRSKLSRKASACLGCLFNHGSDMLLAWQKDDKCH